MQYIKTGNYIYEKMWTRFKNSKVRDMADHAPATGGDHSGFRVGRGVYRGQGRDNGDQVRFFKGRRGKEYKEKNGNGFCC